MPYRRILPCVCLALSAWLVMQNLPVAQSASLRLRLNEAATKVRLADSQTQVTLALENLTEQSLPVRLKLEWLAPDDQVKNTVQQQRNVTPGINPINLPLPLSATARPVENSELLWYRLRYRVESATPTGQDQSLLTGILSLSEIAADLFALKVVASEYPIQGQSFRAHVIAVHPLSGQPVRGVRVTGELNFHSSADETEFKASGNTNGAGLALLSFTLPRTLDTAGGELHITAIRGDFHAEANLDLRDETRSLNTVLLQTDKPLYQPGQPLHARALAYDFSKHALPQKNATFTLKDPEGTLVFRSAATTSRFGVASADLVIPASARLGEYRLIVEIGSGDDHTSEYSQSVKISRYDLPNFTVNAEPDRTYYLPGQNAQVTINAAYLFGQPVKHARLRLVREQKRTWNYRQQKWEADEAEEHVAETGADGRCTVQLDLSQLHENLEDTRYQRFKDFSYAAYVADPTTGRTEQRRFDLRLTREAIHVYVLGADYRQTEGVPLQFFLSTFYADGTPAQCEIQLSEALTDEGQTRLADGSEEPLRKLKTNRYGAAKVSNLWLRERERRSNEINLQLHARDNQGRSGTHVENLWLGYTHNVVRIETNKTLYRAGEQLEVSLISNASNASAILSVLNGVQLLHSQVVKLRKGRAFVVLPYQPDFKDELTLCVQGSEDDTSSSQFRSTRRVLYPRDQELKVTARLDKSSYQPGEEAHTTLRVLSPTGRPVESALGVAVIDQAVREQARTEREFGSRPGAQDSFRHYWAEAENFAGIIKRDLRKLDLSQPVPVDLELVAEILLGAEAYEPRLFGDDDLPSPGKVFEQLFNLRLSPVAATLEDVPSGQHPTSPAAFNNLLKQAGLNPAELRDPWEVALRVRCRVRNEFDVAELQSAGADKRFDTGDDFTVREWRWPYFKPHGEALTEAAQKYYARTGTITRDSAAFKHELQAAGFELDALRDRWGQPYRLTCEVQGKLFWVRVYSSGPDKLFATVEATAGDDFLVWSTNLDYFAQTRTKLEAALTQHFHTSSGQFPQTQADLRAALRANGIEFDQLRDPWGRVYEALFYKRLRYTDRVTIHYREYEDIQQRTDQTPVAQQLNFITLHSRGADGEANTADDFEVAEFSRLVTEARAVMATSKTADRAPVVTGATGTLSGVVMDANEAVIPNTEITAKRQDGTLEKKARTDQIGQYLLRDLPAGIYELHCVANGFKRSVVTDVPVRSATLTEVNFSLEVGGTSEAVAITSEAAVMQTQSASSSSAAKVKTVPQFATPRLREYFPETLLWRPLLETDRQGRAQLNFKLADNITTWKMSVLASTETGEVGAAETDIRAFQPFFIEHDPPRILTIGDEIALPVVLRNYLNQPLTIQTALKPESWFELLSPAQQRSTVAAGEAGRVLFNFRALTAGEGKQRLTALARQTSDAVEKPVTVHPDGEECTQTASDIFNESATLDLTLPSTVIKGSLHAELKLYPNLLAHALEGIEGILQRPHGCGEQTISSTYPNLLVLRHLTTHDTVRHTAVKTQALQYLQQGYQRLLGYQSEDGGFSYWGYGDSDLALTAYALRFLNDATELITVDTDVLDKTRHYLLKTQRDDGSWPIKSWYSGAEHQRTAMQTALAARSLAGLKTQADAANLKANSAQALQRALAYLAQTTAELDEPYTLALYALAALEAGAHEHTAQPLARLRALAQTEADTSYWLLEGNTPFYGWGLAGRLETTALAVRAFALAQQKTASNATAQKDRALLKRGLLFLLRNQDRHGVWLSTQATVNVHDALQILDDITAEKSAQTAAAEVFVNGQRVATVALPPAQQLSAPLTVDLTPHLTTGPQRIEVRRPGGTVGASAQLSATYYQPWPITKTASRATNTAQPNSSNALRLAVSYDRTTASIGQEIRCTVVAARTGQHGYGMLLAEIGLPPGAEVDRASLEKARREAGGALNQYDILPDRVIFYLWPQSGELKFAFGFRPRFGLKALSAPAVLYDYYNPAARVTVAPTRFEVR